MPSPVPNTGKERARVVRQVIGFAIATILIGLAGAMVWRDREAISMIRRAITAGNAPRLAGVWGLVALNLVCTSATFWFLTPLDKHGRPRVGAREMFFLICGANLSNYLPLRAGMLGRMAYHRAYNAIPVRESAVILFRSLLLSAGAVVTLAFLGATVLRSDRGIVAWAQVGAVVLPLIAAFGVAILMRHQSGGRGGVARTALAFAARYADMLCWAARYAIVFSAAGLDLSWSQAIAYTAIAQVSMTIPIVGNGLGLREWMIGVVGAVLPVWAVGTVSMTTRDQRLAAELVHRGVELLAILPLGMIGAMWVARRVARGRQGTNAVEPDGSASIEQDGNAP
ncbi:MAG: hypothetical protein AB7V21_13230 [Phycisphaerales bacterium]